MRLPKSTVVVLAFLGGLFFFIYLLVLLTTQTTEDLYKTNTCPWKFKEYIHSPYEKMWLDHAKEWGESPCTRYKQDNNDEIAQKWYKYTAAAMNSRPSQPPDTKIFSTFIYQRTCNGEQKKIYIEPLALLLRSPIVCAKFGTYDFDQHYNLVDKNYMLVDWEIAQQRNDTNGRTFLFDMGASLYNSGAGGASQAWFVENIEKRGLKLDGIYAWEYIVHDAKTVFADIPERLWPIYHWYNIPVSDTKGSLSNPWEMLKQVVTKDDMVIVKLDIDSPGLEASLITQLIENKPIHELIDVLYYEDHFDTVEMRSSFGLGLTRKLSDAMGFFVKMRQRGIRAHPWV
eukprot:Phypoly_transcript_11958.p1 GENE.Phypoly_transcript_11958~~Phypoly_transcript_11958.p1  ORF type:complete len:342 (+),score=28.47 Phypoly_transcript_11958:143-1168(+)